MKRQVYKQKERANLIRKDKSITPTWRSGIKQIPMITEL